MNTPATPTKLARALAEFLESPAGMGSLGCLLDDATTAAMPPTEAARAWILMAYAELQTKRTDARTTQEHEILTKHDAACVLEEFEGACGTAPSPAMRWTMPKRS